MNIIIADDSKILRQRIINLLKEIKGIKVIAEADNSHQAIQLVEELHPDLIVLDIRMPDGSGLEVLKMMKKKNLSVLKLVLTNYPLEQYRKKCQELGADYFFDKSTEFEQMFKVVQKLSHNNESSNKERII
jgi:DNA-binding NarL/FixJ family response regulator